MIVNNNEWEILSLVKEFLTVKRNIKSKRRENFVKKQI